jgi:hypothetical protein
MFEDWGNQSYSSNQMKSAKWKMVQSGFANTFCGAAMDKQSERGLGVHTAAERATEKALSFRGSDPRYAETEAIDVTSGATLEFSMFMPPLGYDVSHPLCKTGYIGTVLVQYSVSTGQNWTTLKAFDPALYRTTAFFDVSIPLPTSALSNATMIRFYQPIFEANRDNWAIDNVRVLRLFPSKWSATAAFKSMLHTSRQILQYAQCCVDTDWCNRRFTTIERDTCPAMFSEWYSSGMPFLFR